jgi:hypothetical protein
MLCGLLVVLAEGALSGCTTISNSPGRVTRTHESTTSAAAARCTTQGRVTCDRASASGIARGPVVTVAAGAGKPPTPTFGRLVEGAYQLTAETLYGDHPPDASLPNVGDRLRAVIRVHCDVFDSIGSYSQRDAGLNLSFEGNGCGRLLPRIVSLLELSGQVPDASDLAADDVMYTATRGKLTLISVRPYDDSRWGIVAGSYTVVDTYTLLSSDSLDSSSGDAAASRARSTLPERAAGARRALRPGPGASAVRVRRRCLGAMHQLRDLCTPACRRLRFSGCAAGCELRRECR